MTTYHLVGDGPGADVLAEAIFSIGGDIVGADDAEITIVASGPASETAAALGGVVDGRSVLVVPPLAARPADADRLLRVVAAGGRISLGESLLFAPYVAAFRNAVTGIGRLDHLGIRFRQTAPSWGSTATEADGGGVALDLGTRAVILALHLLPDRTPVGVRGRFDSRSLDVEERADIQVRFDDGLVVGIEVAWTDDDAVLDIQAASADSAAFCQLLPEVVVELDGTAVSGTPGALPDPPEPNPLTDLGYAAMVQEAAYAHRIDAPIRVAPLTLGHQALEVIAGAAEAAAVGQETTLPLTGDRTRTPVQRWRRT